MPVVPDMQRRHFAFIASCIAQFGHYSGEAGKRDNQTRKDLAEHFATALRATNGQFQRDKFLRACGVED